MWPDSRWAPAIGSFGTPVPVPPGDPNASPTRTFTVSCAWLPYIRGALLQLVLQATWATDDPAVRLLAQQRAMTLISMFDECAASDLPFACPFDFSVGKESWELASVLVPGWGRTGGVYNTGGPWWQATDDAYGGGCGYFLDILRPFSPAARLTEVSFTYDLFKGAIGIDTPQNGIWLYDSAFTALATQLVPSSSDADGSGKTIVWAGDQTGVSYVRASLVASWTACGAEAGFARIHAANIQGIGAVSCT